MEHLNSFLGEYFLGFFSEAYDKHLGFMGDLETWERRNGFNQSPRSRELPSRDHIMPGPRETQRESE